MDVSAAATLAMSQHPHTLLVIEQYSHVHGGQCAWGAARERVPPKMQNQSLAGLSADNVQRLLVVDSQAAVRALLQECPEIFELEPALILSRLIRLKVRACLHILYFLTGYFSILPRCFKKVFLLSQAVQMTRMMC